jgi:integrase
MKLDEWVETVWNVIPVRPKTLQSYRNLYRRQISPVVGQQEVDQVDFLALQRKILSLPPQTARHTVMVSKTIAREAVLYGITKENFASKLKSPPIQETPKKFLTWEEVDSKSWGTYDEQIRFLALHGLRWSEAVVLGEKDIHDGFVWVNRTVNGNCKSKSSVRKIPYLGHFKPLPKSYKPLQIASNKHGVTVHSFRRTYAYLLKTQGIHVTTAQKLLGHSDPILTLKVYTSVLDDEIDDVKEKLLNVISDMG